MGGSGDFIDSFTAHPQRDQQATDLGWRGIAIKQGGKGGFRLGAGEGAVTGNTDQGF
jgi:hypothetical protein